MKHLLPELERRAQHAPDELALVGTQRSYCVAELVQAVQEMAVALRDTTVDVVALYADNSPQWAIVDLACQSLDICLVPIPTFFSSQQIRHTLSTAGVELVLYDTGLSGNLVDLAKSGEPSSLGGYGVQRLEALQKIPRPAGTNKITFTSGSTGDPKGVCLSTEQCLAVAASLAVVIDVEKPRHLCVLPLSTLLENIAGLYMPLLSGGCAVILDPQELGMTGSSGLSAEVFLKAIDVSGLQTMILVPQLLLVLDHALQSGWQPPTSLAFVAVGGARVAPELLQRVSKAGIPVYEGYGLSECASVVSLNAPNAARPGSGGKVLSHVDLAVRDGEIIVSGNPFLGYLGSPESWGAKEIATGDLGEVSEDGFVSVQGRKKNVLISSFGRNISPEWVESESMSSGYFTQALVLGDGRPFCIALVLPADRSASDSAITKQIQSLNLQLPDYARVGRWLRLDAPLASIEGLMTSNGRPRRDQIAAHFYAQIERLYSESMESNLA